MVVGTTQGVVVMAMNQDQEALADPEVRRAIHHAIDKESVLAAAVAGYGDALGGPSVPTDPYFVDFTDTYEYDPEAAEDLLASAGAEDLSLTFNVPNRAYAEASAQVIQDNLSAISSSFTRDNSTFSLSE